jgi:ankyrin repeat protein
MSYQHETQLLMQAIGRGSSLDAIIQLVNRNPAMTNQNINRTDPTSGVTPLMMLTARPDSDETVEIAEYLVSIGAGIDTPDTSGPGGTPLLMACQEGKPKLLKFLIDQGAVIDRPPGNSRTEPIVFAAQHGHASCVALLAEAAANQGKQASFFEAGSLEGRTSAYCGVEQGMSDVVGVLAKAGADLRKACPVYFFNTGLFGRSIR